VRRRDGHATAFRPQHPSCPSSQHGVELSGWASGQRAESRYLLCASPPVHAAAACFPKILPDQVGVPLVKSRMRTVTGHLARTEQAFLTPPPIFRLFSGYRPTCWGRYSSCLCNAYSCSVGQYTTRTCLLVHHTHMCSRYTCRYIIRKDALFRYNIAAYVWFRYIIQQYVLYRNIIVMCRYRCQEYVHMPVHNSKRCTVPVQYCSVCMVPVYYSTICTVPQHYCHMPVQMSKICSMSVHCSIWCVCR
jgi:hypothetical protein